MGDMRPGIVLLDPHPIWLDSIQTVLAGLGIAVAAATTIPEEALAAISRLAPRYFALDPAVREGESEWLRLIPEAMALDSELVVLAFSESSDLDLVRGAFDAGAAAFVVKTAYERDIAAALRLAERTAVHVPSSFAGAPEEDEALTRREFEILRLVAEGHSNAVIGRELWLAEQTVKFHLSNVYRKIGVQNRTAAARWAELHGVSSLEPPDSIAREVERAS